MALFVFSDQNLSNLLESQHRQGVQIRALIDPGFMYRDYSEGLDLLGLALPNQQCRYGEGNRPWASPITTVGIPLLADGDVLHHKFGLVDDRIVVTGSQNWSLTANESNDENLLVIDNPTVAAHFQREFEQLYAEATLGIPDWLQQRVQEQAARCEG
jgi:phosphatidylserine/phosphatidylglycerophosphate/cardiolipin synthase-like enzyme